MGDQYLHDTVMTIVKQLNKEKKSLGDERLWFAQPQTVNSGRTEARLNRNANWFCSIV